MYNRVNRVGNPLFSHVKNIAIGYVNIFKYFILLDWFLSSQWKKPLHFYGQVLPGHHCVWIVNDHVAETMLV